MSLNRESITVERNGKKYTGSFKVEKGFITVYAGLAQKTTQVGGSGTNQATIKGLAGLILSELINEGEVNPD
jgi:hypothetical protein